MTRSRAFQEVPADCLAVVVLDGALVGVDAGVLLFGRLVQPALLLGLLPDGTRHPLTPGVLGRPVPVDGLGEPVLGLGQPPRVPAFGAPPAEPSQPWGQERVPDRSGTRREISSRHRRRRPSRRPLEGLQIGAMDIDRECAGQDPAQFQDALLHRSGTLCRLGGTPGRPVAAGVTITGSAHRLTPLTSKVTAQPRSATNMTESWQGHCLPSTPCFLLQVHLQTHRVHPPERPLGGNSARLPVSSCRTERLRVTMAG